VAFSQEELTCVLLEAKPAIDAANATIARASKTFGTIDFQTAQGASSIARKTKQESSRRRIRMIGSVQQARLAEDEHIAEEGLDLEEETLC
jgi:hypothetical protein